MSTRFEQPPEGRKPEGALTDVTEVDGSPLSDPPVHGHHHAHVPTALLAALGLILLAAGVRFVPRWLGYRPGFASILTVEQAEAEWGRPLPGLRGEFRPATPGRNLVLLAPRGRCRIRPGRILLWSGAPLTEAGVRLVDGDGRILLSKTIDGSGDGIIIPLPDALSKTLTPGGRYSLEVVAGEEPARSIGGFEVDGMVDQPDPYTRYLLTPRVPPVPDHLLLGIGERSLDVNASDSLVVAMGLLTNHPRHPLAARLGLAALRAMDLEGQHRWNEWVEIVNDAR